MNGGVQAPEFSITAILIAESMTLHKPGPHPSPAITMSCCSWHMWLLCLSHWGLRKREKCTTVQSHEGESVLEPHTLYIYLLMMSPAMSHQLTVSLTITLIGYSWTGHE